MRVFVIIQNYWGKRPDCLTAYGLLDTVYQVWIVNLVKMDEKIWHFMRQRTKVPLKFSMWSIDTLLDCDLVIFQLHTQGTTYYAYRLPIIFKRWAWLFLSLSLHSFHQWTFQWWNERWAVKLVSMISYQKRSSFFSNRLSFLLENKVTRANVCHHLKMEAP